ncbi:MAG: hypothetical protein HY716_02015 [Planctomycetes bacterium]|nr:hypothetical protein [Planctomycetota bacterium]
MARKLAVGALWICLAASVAAAQDKGGKIPWKHDPQANMAEAKGKGLAMMLYFTSDG